MSDKEFEIRKKLRRILEKDFYIYEECDGRCKHKNTPVRYDLVIKAKEHLVQQGFHDGYVIIEVKIFSPNDSVKPDKKAKNLLWQCITYSFSEIKLNHDTWETPAFVLAYTEGIEYADEKHKDIIRQLFFFVERGAVGELQIINNNDWKIIFGGSCCYFNSKKGIRKDYTTGKRKVDRRQIGSA